MFLCGNCIDFVLFIAIVISIILLTMCNYLHANEIKKDIALSRCIGASKKQSSKFVYTHSFLMCFISLILSFVELFLSTVFISIIMKNILKIEMQLSVNIFTYLLMTFVAIFISLFSSIFISKRVKKYRPIDALRN